MFTVYVLRNCDGRLYVGHTSDLERRLAEHNSGLSRWTSKWGPWDLVHQEGFETSGEAMIRERLKRARKEGDLPADADPAALASFIATVTQGMAVQAASGAGRKHLRDIAKLALNAWPSKAKLDAGS